ncbi:MAG: hypothetical protein AAF653_12340, partial [Chloroflexota bacterium]
PPPRFLSQLRRMQMTEAAIEQTIVVCAPPVQIAFLENLLYLTTPGLLKKLTFTSDPQQAVNLLKNNSSTAH